MWWGARLTSRYGLGRFIMVEEYDLDKNGKLDAEERQLYLEDRRRKIEDDDAKRDAQRNMTWFALSGMVLYPLGIFLCTVIGQETAAMLIADIANIYVVSVSALVGAYFGFTAMGSKK